MCAREVKQFLSYDGFKVSYEAFAEATMPSGTVELLGFVKKLRKNQPLHILSYDVLVVCYDGFILNYDAFAPSYDPSRHV